MRLFFHQHLHYGNSHDDEYIHTYLCGEYFVPSGGPLICRVRGLRMGFHNPCSEASIDYGRVSYLTRANGHAEALKKSDAEAAGRTNNFQG